MSWVSEVKAREHSAALIASANAWAARRLELLTKKKAKRMRREAKKEPDTTLRLHLVAGLSPYIRTTNVWWELTFVQYDAWGAFSGSKEGVYMPLGLCRRNP